MSKTWTFLEDDKLNRSNYAHFIQHLVLNCDMYRRNTETDSYSIALDAPFGTGKTSFLHMLCEDIKQAHNGISVIYYNAWKHDMSEDAFSPLMLDVLNHPIFDEKRFKNIKKKGVRVTIKEVFVPIFKAVAKQAYTHVLGEPAGEIIEGVIDGVSGIEDTPAKFEEWTTKYQEFHKKIEEFGLLLGECIAGTTTKKLLVVIDELDRCKPLFAIKTLEFVKHIMNGRNVVFLFAVDLSQLRHSIKTIYGAEMNAEGYLMRFFDYCTKMPKPSEATFVKALSSDDDFLNPEIQTFFITLLEIFSFSLRDIETIFQHYKILSKMILTSYPDREAHKLYIFLLFLKYKDAEGFSSFLNGDLPKPPEKAWQKIEINKDTISNLSSNAKKKICDEEIKISVQSPTRIAPEVGGKCSIKNTDSDGWHIVRCIDGFAPIIITANGVKTRDGQYDPSYSSELTINKLLFINDLANLSEIMGCTFGEYLHQQLECFNFSES